MLVKKLMAGVFAIAILSGVVGNVGTINASAATPLGKLTDANFNQYCYSINPEKLGTAYHYYNFSTYRCVAYNGWNQLIWTSSVNWDNVCKYKYGNPWLSNTYAVWRSCYRS